ncbi:hypothetical protein MMC29_002024 [Sticta canariensis]|nr:hypothetical protein [Sticta canariensis]
MFLILGAYKNGLMTAAVMLFTSQHLKIEQICRLARLELEYGGEEEYSWAGTDPGISFLIESEAPTFVDYVHNDRGLPKFGLPYGRWSWIYVGPLLYRVCSAERPAISVESTDEVQHTPSPSRIRVGMPTSPTSPGTAIWLTGVVRELPNAQLDGFDVDLAPASTQQWLPSNVRLRHFDVFDDIPDDLQGKYEIVHVRLLLMDVKSSDPRPIIRDLVKLLKYGGHLQ